MSADPTIARWPAGASTEYVAARNELLKAEFDLRNQIERVAALRRALPTGGTMPEYTFAEGSRDVGEDGPSTTPSLYDLVADGRSLVVYHLMFPPSSDAPCPMCAALVDGLNGVAIHLSQRVNFVVIAKAPLEQLRRFRVQRGWDQVRLLSSANSSFNRDMNVEQPHWMPDADQMPGLSVFKKGEGEGTVEHVYSLTAHFDKETVRGADLISPLWNVLDLVPEGRGEWMPSLEYA